MSGMNIDWNRGPLAKLHFNFQTAGLLFFGVRKFFWALDARQSWPFPQFMVNLVSVFGASHANWGVWGGCLQQNDESELGPCEMVSGLRPSLKMPPADLRNMQIDPKAYCRDLAFPNGQAMPTLARPTLTYTPRPKSWVSKLLNSRCFNKYREHTPSRIKQTTNRFCTVGRCRRLPGPAVFGRAAQNPGSLPLIHLRGGPPGVRPAAVVLVRSVSVIFDLLATFMLVWIVSDIFFGHVHIWRFPKLGVPLNRPF